MEVTTKNEECIELKNIKYKTMLLSGNIINDYKSSNEDLCNLDKFLEDDKQNNKNEPWSKLDKTIKTKKILFFVEKYSKENNFNEEEENMLILFLKECLDRKKLQRNLVMDLAVGPNLPAVGSAKPILMMDARNVAIADIESVSRIPFPILSK